MLERVNVSIEWEGKTYEVIPNPELVQAIEARPDGVALMEITQSQRMTDHAHIIYCGLRQAGATVSKQSVLAAVMDDLNLWTEKALAICLELVAPASKLAQAVDETIEAGKAAQEGN